MGALTAQGKKGTHRGPLKTERTAVGPDRWQAAS